MTDINLIECELYIAMNEDGSWIVRTDESDALADLQTDEGGYHARVVNVTVKMLPPKMDEAEVVVPDSAGTLAAQAS